MDRREQIWRILRGERVERLPRALFGGGRWACLQTGLELKDLDKDPRRFANELAGLFEELDTDIVFAGSGLNSFPAEAIGGELAFREGQAPLLSHPIIEKTEDARYFEKITIADSPRSLALVEMTARLRERLLGRFLCCTSWGPYTWAMILCDWNLLRERTLSDRAFIREICELGVRLTSALFEPLVEKELIDGIVISDGAATLIPFDLYQEVVLPAERKVLERFKDRGVARFLHQCGNISAQYPLYPDTGADCVTLDAGVDLGAAYREYRGRLAIAGNVDVIRHVYGGSPGTICDAVHACVSGIPDPFQRFILMPSCDLPPDTPLDNAKAFLSCADQWTASSSGPC
jgi:uroporphyrinogen decarboxylase